MSILLQRTKMAKHQSSVVAKRATKKLARCCWNNVILTLILQTKDGQTHRFWAAHQKHAGVVNMLLKTVDVSLILQTEMAKD